MTSIANLLGQFHIMSPTCLFNFVRGLKCKHARYETGLNMIKHQAWFMFYGFPSIISSLIFVLWFFPDIFLIYTKQSRITDQMVHFMLHPTAFHFSEIPKDAWFRLEKQFCLECFYSQFVNLPLMIIAFAVENPKKLWSSECLWLFKFTMFWANIHRMNRPERQGIHVLNRKIKNVLI
jgi:hypothetical protein